MSGHSKWNNIKRKKEAFNKDTFRYGVSRVGNALMSAIEGKEIKFF